MNELLPCPFHKNKQSATLLITRQLNDNLWYARCGCQRCGISQLAYGQTKDKALEAAREAWNTRYEHTCHNKSVEGKQMLLCSKCGAFTKVTNATEYIAVHRCGNCGAKVVDE